MTTEELKGEWRSALLEVANQVCPAELQTIVMWASASCRRSIPVEFAIRTLQQTGEYRVTQKKVDGAFFVSRIPAILRRTGV